MSVDVIVPGDGLTAEVASEIRARMGRDNVTRAELARRLRVEDSWVGKRLNGRTEIGLSDLQRIARALNVAVVDLLPATAKGGSSTPTYAYDEAVSDLLAEPVLVSAPALASAPRRLGSPLSSTYPRGSRPPGRPTGRGPSGPRHAARTGR